MAILDTLKEKIMPRPGAPIGPAVKAKLDRAELELEALNAKLGDLALDAELGTDGAEGALDRYRTDVETLRNRVEELRASYNVAMQRDADAIASARASVLKSQIAATRQHFAARDAALEKMSGHLAAGIAEYQNAIKAGAKAAAACPTEMPLASLVSRGAMDRLLKDEIYRLSAPLIAGHDAVVAHRLAFAGVRPNDLGMMGTPEKIEPIAVLAARSTEYAIARIKGTSLPVGQASAAPVIAAEATGQPEPEPPEYRPDGREIRPDGPTVDVRNYVMPAPTRMRLTDE